MSNFISKHSDGKILNDGIFGVAKEAREKKAILGKEKVIDSTLGVFFNEEEELATISTIFDTYNQMESVKKAKYSEAIIGNKMYLDAVEDWVLMGVERDFYVRSVATAGGTGAISNAMWNLLDEGQTIIIPNICWGSYKVMAEEFSLNIEEYSLFNNERKFGVDSLLEKCNKAMDEQGKVMVIINDPCHNPTGYTMEDKEWVEVIEGLNKIAEKGPVILVNDIAYMDFSIRGLSESRKYINNFNKISENMMVIITFSMSKSFTSYGFRVGAQVALSKKEDVVEEFKNISEFTCRAKWSNIPNGAMEIFSQIVNHPELLEKSNKERQEYVEMLGKRGDIFMSEAEECQLPIYPYKEGFFVTLELERELAVKVQEALKEKNIYTVVVGGGMRIALCSLPQSKARGLAYTIKETLDEVKNS